MVDVVTAVAESELALETLVAVRDKVIAAYEEIMRMPGMKVGSSHDDGR